MTHRRPSHHHRHHHRDYPVQRCHGVEQTGEMTKKDSPQLLQVSLVPLDDTHPCSSFVNTNLTNAVITLTPTPAPLGSTWYAAEINASVIIPPFNYNMPINLTFILTYNNTNILTITRSFMMPAPGPSALFNDVEMITHPLPGPGAYNVQFMISQQYPGPTAYMNCFARTFQLNSLSSVPSLGDTYIPTQCQGTSSVIDNLQVTTDVTPTRGSNVTFTLSGNVNSPIYATDKLNITLTKAFLHYPYSDTVGSLLGDTGVAFPITSGPISLSKQFTIPSIAPSGSYQANLSLTDSQENQKACYSISFFLQ